MSGLTGNHVSLNLGLFAVFKANFSRSLVLRSSSVSIWPDEITVLYDTVSPKTIFIDLSCSRSISSACRFVSDYKGMLLVAVLRIEQL